MRFLHLRNAAQVALVRADATTRMQACSEWLFSVLIHYDIPVPRYRSLKFKSVGLKEILGSLKENGTTFTETHRLKINS